MPGPGYPNPSGGAGAAAVVTKLTGGDVTTASASFVDLTGGTVTASCGTGGVILVTVVLVSSHGTSGQSVTIDLKVDGTRVGGTNFGLITYVAPGNGTRVNASFSYIASGLASGSHTFQLSWLTSGATATAYADTNQPLIIAAKEIT